MSDEIRQLYSPRAELQLAEALRRGELPAYQRLYDGYAPRLRRIIERMYGDGALAADAIQSTFLIVFRKIDQYGGRSSLTSWLARICIREARRLARDRRLSLERSPAVEPVLLPAFEDAYADQELCRRMAALISALPEEKRTALLLFELEGLSAQEIADISGEPRGTVLARLSRTRAELRSALRAWSGDTVEGPLQENPQIENKDVQSE